MIAVVNNPGLRQQTIMEHRWGTRVELDHPVLLETGGEQHEGRLRNASISGALIATSARLPLYSEVDVALTAYLHGEPRQMRLAARVVRAQEGCVGVEWSDMACRPLIALLREAGVGNSLWERDRAFG